MRLILIVGICLFFSLSIHSQPVNRTPGIDFSAFRQKIMQRDSAKIRVLLPNQAGELIPVSLVSEQILPSSLQDKYPTLSAWRGIALDGSQWRVRLENHPDAVLLEWIKGRKRDRLTWKETKLETEPKITTAAIPKMPCRWQPSGQSASLRSALPLEQERWTLRLAMTTTYSFTQYHGGSKEQTMAALVTIVNRLNEVYERDIGIRFVIPDGQDTLIVTDPNTLDLPFGSEDLVNQRFIDERLGSEGYDIGHILDGGSAGGYAILGGVCDDREKAKGYTASPSGSGDFLVIDFLAHELGHQLGATHTFNGIGGSCAFNRFDPTAVEPGSGSTIMGYAGLCGGDNLQAASDAYFHVVSTQQITFLATSRAAEGCGELVPIENQLPVVTGLPEGQTIPKGTPFQLQAEVVDPEGQQVLMSWDEVDNGEGSSINVPELIGPLLRHRPPDTTALQVFPGWRGLVTGQLDPGDQLPDASRDINFELYIRNAGEQGMVRRMASIPLEVTDKAGPFRVLGTRNEVSWIPGDLERIFWDVANTDQPPVNARQVDVWLVSESDENQRYLLAAGLPNVGETLVEVPDSLPDDRYYVTVQGHNHLFFGLSPYTIRLVPDSSTLFAAGIFPEAPVYCQTDTGQVQLRIGGVGEVQGEPATFRVRATEGLIIQPDTGTVSRDELLSLEASFTGTAAAGRYLVDVDVYSPEGETFTLTILMESQRPVGEMPDLRLPLNGAEQVAPFATQLSWNGLATTDTYELRLLDTDGQEQVWIANDSVFVLPRELQAAKSYSWQVRGKSATCGAGPWSESSTFTTRQYDCDTIAIRDTFQFGSIPFTNIEFSVGLQNPITDVNVLAIDGAYDGPEDPGFRLRSPAGPSLDLLVQGEGCPHSGPFSYRFDDAFPLADDCLNGGETKQLPPVEALATYRDQSPSGVWRLFAFHRSNTEGYINRVSLEVCREPAVVSLDEPPGRASSWMLYPNPASEEVTIFGSGVLAGNGICRIFNSQGKLMSVQSRSLADGFTIATDQWSQGMYTYQILTEHDEPLDYGQFIIQRPD
jgi:hypothetical protein